MISLVGQRVGPYRVAAEIGAGGMGTVYLATVEDLVAGLPLGERVALKLVHRHLSERPDARRRFLREFQLGRRVRHANVVATLDGDAPDDAGAPSYLAMELVEGRTLRALLAEIGAAPDPLLREIARQIADGLAAIHAAGIVHRDLKPENVLITVDERVRIMDLGVARLVEESMALTSEGAFVGSLLYAAPEQFRGGKIGPASDLYSLGVLLYELASGANPFERESTASVIAAHLNETPRPVSDADRGTSPFLVAVIATLLAKSPGDRFASAQELSDVLAEGERSAWWLARERRLRATATELPRLPVRRPTSFHGRDAQIGALVSAWRRAAEGAGGTVLLEGEAGAGKTRLLDAFVRGVSPDSAHVLYGAYAPPGGIGAVSEAIVERFGASGLEEALSPHLAAAPRLVPPFAALLRNEDPPPGFSPLSPQALHAALSHLVRGLARDRPVLWIVDDLQLAEPTSRQLVLSLARAAEGQRALIVVATRPGVPSDELEHFARLAEFRRVAVGRLTADDVRGLVRDAFRGLADVDRIADTVARKSDGVPLFALAMIQALRDAGVVREREDGRFETTGPIDDVEAPSAVRDFVRARLAGLSDDDRALLDVAAVVGHDVDADLVARVRGMKRVVVLERLAGLERRGNVLRSEGGRCRFDHHQIREVLYADLMPELRAEYHSLAAEAIVDRAGGEEAADRLDGETTYRLADHHLRGVRPEAAARRLARAAAHLASQYRHVAALDLADRALAVPGLLEGAARETALHRKSEALDLLGRRAEQRKALDEALAIADASGDPARRAGARRRLGWHLHLTSNNDAARATLVEAVDIAGAAGARTEEVVSTGNLATALLSLAQFDAARECCERQLRLAIELGDRKEEATARGTLGIISLRQGRADDARRHYELHLAAAREIGDRRGEGVITLNLGNIWNDAGDREKARDHYSRAGAIFREIGDRRGEAAVAGSFGNVLKHVGRYGEALEQFEAHRSLARATGSRDGEAIALVNLAGVLTPLGAPERGAEAAQRALAIFHEIGAKREESYASFEAAQAAETLGDEDAAERLYAESLELRRRVGYPRGVAETQLARGRLFAARGRRDEAAACLDESVRLSRELSLVDGLVLATAYADLVSGAADGESAPRLAESASRLRHSTLIEAQFVVWRRTGEAASLVAAHDALRRLVDGAPTEFRGSAVERVPLHRAIAAAWESRV
jgi:predicted ATPase